MRRSSRGWEDSLDGARLELWKAGEGVRTHEPSEVTESQSPSGHNSGVWKRGEREREKGRERERVKL